MSENPSPPRPVTPPPYLREETPDKQFEAALANVLWQTVEAYHLLVLEADCPVCHHKNAINKAVPTVSALPFLSTYTGTAATSTFVECLCEENHQAPAGACGCGRWGMVVPRVAAVSPDDLNLDDAPFTSEPAAAERAPEDDKDGEDKDEKGTGDDDAH